MLVMETGPYREVLLALHLTKPRHCSLESELHAKARDTDYGRALSAVMVLSTVAAVRDMLMHEQTCQGHSW